MRRTIASLISIFIVFAAADAFAQQPSLVFFRIPSDAMEPAISQGSMVVNEPINAPLTRGEIVLVRIRSNDKLLHALRIVGLPKDRIELVDGRAVINSGLLADPGLRKPTDQRPPPKYSEYPRPGETYIVPAGSMYVLADNRSEGVDSRYFGPIEAGNVLGRIYPWSDVLKIEGRPRIFLQRNFAPLVSRLPLLLGDGLTLRDLTVIDDRTIHITYSTELDFTSSPQSAELAVIKSYIHESNCSNAFVKLATGTLIKYTVMDRSLRPIVEVEFSQAECSRLPQ
jgi:signal peptidase I